MKSGADSLLRGMKDQFFEKQPEVRFDRELKKKDVLAIPGGSTVSPGIFLKTGDFAGTEILETIFFEFRRFLKKNKISGRKYAIRLERTENFEREEFEISAEKESCTLSAGEPEGIRRGLIRIEELLISGRGRLPPGVVRERAVIKRRISRCFFSPINRPPKNRAELDDDEDYYPDEYLYRFMRDGINAIWIGADFDSLLTSSFISEYGKGCEKRIAKLIAITEKCAKYGIDVFLFVIEPIAFTNFSVQRKHPGIEKKYPQTYGNRLEEEIAFCTYTDFGTNYVLEAVEKLFRQVPRLGGLISITQGERITSCSTVYPDGEFNWHNNCPHCGHISRSEILAHTVNLIREGMRRVKPEADFISWTYGHREWERSEIGEYLEKVPGDAVTMQNFEDNGRALQLGKNRVAIDYWLSYAGPSEMFYFTAEQARIFGKRLYAKMQICCSHELATVPYIPVPGLVYEKLTGAKELGVEGIMESWFFGSYPCLMSKAAELLFSEREYPSKASFLNALARLYWEDRSVPRVVRAWECFERGYRQIPLNVMFSYYGPMHDGIVWELSLIPKNLALPRSWKLEDPVCGDRFGECLFQGHTAAEAAELLDALNEEWRKGCEILSDLPEWNAPFHEQISVIKALALLFDSGRNVTWFYKLRNDLGYGRGDPEEVLTKMEKLVFREIENSRKMIPLCLADNRLGFHSEAEGFKFFPKKLTVRIEKLERLLKEDFPAVRARIDKGVLPLAYYAGEAEGKRYHASRDGLARAEWETLSDGKSKFRMSAGKEELELELFSTQKTDFLICLETELMFPGTAVIVKSDGRVVIHRDCITHQSVVDGKIEEERRKWRAERLPGIGVRLRVSICKGDAGFIRFPFKMLVKTFSRATWCDEGEDIETLGKSELSPGAFGWID